MAITAISPQTNDARSELVKYQQKLAADLSAKAAAKVITADKNAVAQAQLEIQRAQQAQQTEQTEKAQWADKAQMVEQTRKITGTGATGVTTSASGVSGTVDMTM
jgi:CRISPR/Cas system-associated endonuclease Cas1